MSHYAMERGWQEHPFFDGDEYSRRDAWEWLVANAVWQDTKARISGKITELKRGQLSHSIRFLAEKWKWHRAKVERFLNALKTESMIETQAETGQLVITIRNYDKFQVSARKNQAAGETKTKTAARQQRDKEEEGKEKNIDTKTRVYPDGFVLPAWVPADPWEGLMEIRDAAPKAAQTARALNSLVGELERLAAKGHDPTEILEKSVRSGWIDIYEPKEYSHAKPAQKKPTIDIVAEQTIKARAARQQQCAEPA
jgi:DNA-binding transcriptional regulator YhcF (GntR family)